jgi:hypothetical protein
MYNTLMVPQYNFPHVLLNNFLFMLHGKTIDCNVTWDWWIFAGWKVSPAKLGKSLYIHTFHWTCPINLCLQCADDWWIHKLVLMGPLSFPQMCKSLRNFQFVYHRAFPQCAVQWWIFNTFSIGLHLNVQFTDESTIQFAMDPCLNEQLPDEFSTHVPWNDFGFQTEVWQVNIFTLQG